MMKWMTLLFLLLAQPCFGQDEPANGRANESLSEQKPSESTKEVPPSQKSISKNVWMHFVQLNLPTEICKAETEYRRCFDLTPEQCTAMARWFTTTCLDNMNNQLPNSLTSTEGEKWGAIAGSCVNELFYKFLIGKRKEGPDCPPMPTAPNETPEDLTDPTKPADE